VVEQAPAGAEQDRGDVDGDVVDQPGGQGLLDDVRAAYALR